MDTKIDYILYSLTFLSYLRKPRLTIIGQKYAQGPLAQYFEITLKLL